MSGIEIITYSSSVQKSHSTLWSFSKEIFKIQKKLEKDLTQPVALRCLFKNKNSPAIYLLARQHTKRGIYQGFRFHFLTIDPSKIKNYQGGFGFVVFSNYYFFISSSDKNNFNFTLTKGKKYAHKFIKQAEYFTKQEINHSNEMSEFCYKLFNPGRVSGGFKSHTTGSYNKKKHFIQTFVAYQGESLKKLIKENNLSREQKLIILRESACQIQKLIDKGIIHTDFGEHNIIVDIQSENIIQVHLIDFDFSVSAKEQTPQVFHSSVLYSSPKKIKDPAKAIIIHSQYDDVFSLGIMAFRLFTKIVCKTNIYLHMQYFICQNNYDNKLQFNINAFYDYFKKYFNIPSFQDTEVEEIAKQLIVMNPDYRISLLELIEKLDALIQPHLSEEKVTTSNKIEHIPEDTIEALPTPSQDNVPNPSQDNAPSAPTPSDIIPGNNPAPLEHVSAPNSRLNLKFFLYPSSFKMRVYFKYKR